LQADSLLLAMAFDEVFGGGLEKQNWRLRGEQQTKQSKAKNI
jgi:hypothetical protein